MPPIPGIVHWHSLVARHAKTLKDGLARVSRALDAQLAGQPPTKLEPILARNTPKHPIARIRQNQSRWYSTTRSSWNEAVRTFTSSTARSGPKYDRSSFPKSRISQTISRSSGRAPFASTLRPNLTGGALGRTAGGYSLGAGRTGGARYFSHTSGSQAQVVQNVSQAVRAFFISGQKAQYDGVSSKNGEKRYKAVSSLQEDTGRRLSSVPRATPGSRVTFTINPTITALTPLAAVAGFSSSGFDAQSSHLNTDGLLDILSVDFSRSLKDLAAVLNELKRLSALGDLPITYEGSQLEVRFPGCDAETVERLCDELDITRGRVVQDEEFDSFAGTEVALLFPFAPSEVTSECESLFEEPAVKRRPISLEDMLTPDTAAFSTQSDTGVEESVTWDGARLSSPSGYESVRSGSGYDEEWSSEHSPFEYQGFEGIYRFIEELDSTRK